MGREIAITLTDEQQAQLDAMSSALEEAPEELLRRAVVQYLAYDAGYRQAVAEGDAAFERGEFHTLEDVAQEMHDLVDTRIGDRRD